MMYDLIAPFYDAINSELDYSLWADFIEEIVKREYNKRPELVVDLGCGTGKMTLELAKRGYDMIGIDISVEMLDVARSEAEKRGINPLWLCQDLREFELYGTVEVAVCCLDTVNHLTKEKDVSTFFNLVHNYLDKDGLFIFDINGKYKFENVYCDRTYVMEEDGAVCVWQNDYDPQKKTCYFLITLFSECEDGRYERYDETETERMYPLSEIFDLLRKSNLEPIGAYSDFNFTVADDSAERIYVVARCKK